ncbi:MAG: tol-pal system YbgF family protein [Acidiferrobacterales bacterium]
MIHPNFFVPTSSPPASRNFPVIVLLVRAAISFYLLAPATVVLAEGNAEEQFATIESFIAGGARELAMQSIETHQKADIFIESWMRWERLRIRLYRDRGNWSAISARIQTLPASTPASFRQWLLVEAAQAELNARRGATARTHLRQLIWASETTDKQMAYWRRLIIRSYLVDNRIDDARTALLRYKADYRAQSDAWQLLHARVLMRAQDYNQAFRILGDIQTTEATLLRLYAALHSGIYKPKAVMARARRFAGRPRLKPEQLRKTWLLAVHAAQKLEDQVLATAFLELALNTGLPDNPNDPFFPLKADDLWQSYAKLAEVVGNRERLLVGDDTPWLRKADELARSNAVSSRAIYGFLAVRTEATSARDTANQRLTDALFADNKRAVAHAIYARSAYFETPAAIPDSVRYQLANNALKAHDVRQAAIWMKDLRLPPSGEDVGQWTLRRARTLVYAGDTRPAIELLRNMLSERKTLADNMASRTIQVLFDLQAVREHGEAYQLMQMVYDRVEKQSLKRELLYWMGESKVALKQYEKAAELYLRSATKGKEKGGQTKGVDLWGQSARYQAAEALGKAGLVGDARSIYRSLLRIATDAKRRALIERRLQQLWLLENRNTTP